MQKKRKQSRGKISSKFHQYLLKLHQVDGVQAASFIPRNLFVLMTVYDGSDMLAHSCLVTQLGQSIHI